MAKSKKKLPQDLQKWVDARKRHKLSHAHIQMARELGMNPRKFGSLDNHRQESWKAPLPDFIESLYFDRFNKDRPDSVVSVEEIAKTRLGKKEQKRQARTGVADAG